MTTVFERTRSVIETSDFLLRLTRDQSLPDTVRSEARLLLRHYPAADTVRLAGRWEAIRQDEVSKLPGSPKALHPALATWPLLEPLFCDSELPDAPEMGAHPDWATFPALHPIPSAEGGVRILGPAKPMGMGCLSIEYRCFISARSVIFEN
ncbi:BPSL0761 family protein [Pseudomonas capsici]|uniref:BPSL0761 family protein n=1 Tax=Pseudomonas capsici TaxID=2810614 RepID=UPI00298EB775|nr:BPSL0761 family protein [Pseudomonas capsici]